LAPLNIQCEYKVDKEAEKNLINIEARKNILLIAKEAMNNIAKYSQATEAKIELKVINEELYLEITDNGKGFNNENKRSGNGLQNMKQRSEAVGGKLFIKSEKQAGTSIVFLIALAKIND